jgi:peptide/nickel transport system ATP-binding protein
MYGGSIVETGNVMDIFENPLHPYTRLLLAALPTITKREGRLQSIPGTAKVDPGDKLCKFYNRCPDRRDECRESTPGLAEVENGHFCACLRARGVR